MNFRERVLLAQRTRDSSLVVGLDPDPQHFPGGQPTLETMLERTVTVLEATAESAVAVKPNSAFFERFGGAGFDALTEVTARAQRLGLLVILDAKRGDIGNTSRAYADWAFDVVGADAITASPYMGHDSVRAFLERPDRGCFLLCRTSNPGARDFQDLLVDGAPLYEHVARVAGKEWNAHGNVGLVAGATYPDDLARVRQAAGPDVPLLIPGVGAQGGDAAEAIARGGNADGLLALVNVGRAIFNAEDPGAAAQGYRTALSR